MAERTMHAVQYDACGGGSSGLKHVEVAIPSPKKAEVLIKVEAVSLNPMDWKIQKGKMRPIYPRKFPFIPVTDVAGEVCAVGPGVDAFKAGDKVVSMLSMFGGKGLAEYAVAPVKLTVMRPPEVPAPEASGLCICGLTALGALKCLGVTFDGILKPYNVLITAASGGVGHYAVQLAKLANLHVTATCGERNIELLKSLGADEVLDYRTPEGDNLKSPSGKKYDGVVHCIEGISWSKFEPNLTENGKVIDLTLTAGAWMTFVKHKLCFSKKQLLPMMVSPKNEDLKFLVELVKEGKLNTVVDSRHPLGRAEDAWEKSMSGHATGKVVVEMLER